MSRAVGCQRASEGENRKKKDSTDSKLEAKVEKSRRKIKIKKIRKRTLEKSFQKRKCLPAPMHKVTGKVTRTAAGISVETRK